MAFCRLRLAGHMFWTWSKLPMFGDGCYWRIPMWSQRFQVSHYCWGQCWRELEATTKHFAALLVQLHQDVAMLPGGPFLCSVSQLGHAFLTDCGCIPFFAQSKECQGWAIRQNLPRPVCTLVMARVLLKVVEAENPAASAIFNYWATSKFDWQAFHYHDQPLLSWPILHQTTIIDHEGQAIFTILRWNGTRYFPLLHEPPHHWTRRFTGGELLKTSYPERGETRLVN